MTDEPVYRITVARRQDSMTLYRYTWSVHRDTLGFPKVCSSYAWSYKGAKRQAEQAAEKDANRHTYEYMPGRR